MHFALLDGWLIELVSSNCKFLPRRLSALGATGLSGANAGHRLNPFASLREQPYPAKFRIARRGFMAKPMIVMTPKLSSSLLLFNQAPASSR